mgnify:CR=1 FL=1
MNTKLDQSICGEGCPLYREGACEFYEEEGKTLVYVNNKDVEGLYQYMEQEIACGRLPLFPAIKKMENEKLYELQRAFDYASNAHKGLFRKGTKMPYTTHLITTLNYALMLTDDEEVLMAALLHDTVEDTWVTVEDIRNECKALDEQRNAASRTIGGLLKATMKK